jgi:hypothetical protein
MPLAAAQRQLCLAIRPELIGFYLSIARRSHARQYLLHSIDWGFQLLQLFDSSPTIVPSALL